MITEQHPPPRLLPPTSPPASPLTQPHEEEEVGLASNRALQKEQVYSGAGISGEGGGKQIITRSTLKVVIFAFCCLLLLFCYRNYHPTAPSVMSSINGGLKQETEVGPAKEEARLAPFEIRRTVWYYTDSSEQYRELRLLYEENNRRFSKLSNFTFVSLNKVLCREYLSDSTLEAIDALQTALADHPHANRILRFVNLLYILYHHGGVAISDHLLMTESLAWLTNIRGSPFLNGDFTSLRVEMVGFFAPQGSSEPEVVEWGKGPQRQAVCELAIQNYFLAAIKGAHFLQELIKRLTQVVNDKEAMAAAQKEVNLRPSIDFFDFIFQNATLAIMKGKRSSAAVTFGLAAINELYAPAKMERLMGKVAFEQRMALLSHLPLPELEDSVGQFRYFTRIRHEDDLLLYLSSAKQAKNTVMEGSFVRNFLLPLPDARYAYSNPEREDKNQDVWSGLPKLVWVYAAKGVERSGIVSVLLALRIEQAAIEAKLEYREVNDSNIRLYLDNRTIDRIENTLELSYGLIHSKSRSQLVRLALLLQHGGIFIDLSTVLVQGLEWVQHIANISSGKVFDRCNHLPKCFLFWDPLATRPLAWKVAQCNSKSPQSPLFLNTFIAAEQQNPLIREWFDTLLSLLSKTQEEAQEVIDDCANNQSPGETGHQVLAASALSCVLEGRRRAMEVDIDEISTAPTQFYGLWSMSGLGLDKASPPSLVERDLLFEITQLPVEYLEELGGPLLYFVKLSGAQMEELTDYIIQYHQDIRQRVHPQSLVAKYVLGPADFKLAYEGGVLKVKPAQ